MSDDIAAEARAEFLARYHDSPRAAVAAVRTGLAETYRSAVYTEARTRGALEALDAILAGGERCPLCQAPLNRDGSCAVSCAGVGDAP